MPVRDPAERAVKTIRRATRRHFLAEDKIRIILEGLCGEDRIAELCRREGIVQNLYHRWSTEFLEASKKRLAGDTARGGDLGRGQGPSPLEGRSDWATGVGAAWHLMPSASRVAIQSVRERPGWPD
jgi:transposase-like protein